MKNRLRYLHPPLPELPVPFEQRHVVLPAERRPVYRGIQVVRPPVASLLPSSAGEVRRQLGPPGERHGVRGIGQDRAPHDAVLLGGPCPGWPRRQRGGGRCHGGGGGGVHNVSMGERGIVGHDIVR